MLDNDNFKVLSYMMLIKLRATSGNLEEHYNYHKLVQLNKNHARKYFLNLILRDINTILEEKIHL